MDKNELFIEETTDSGYQILWRGVDGHEAINQLNTLKTANRVELWSKGHAETCKGFAPLGYRAANSNKILLSHTFTFLYLNLTSASQ
jgi:hypothetical protein